MNINDIVVRYGGSNYLNLNIGDIRRISSINHKNIKLEETQEDFHMPYFRLATEEEIIAYHDGIRNIKDIVRVEQATKTQEYLIFN